MNLRTVPNNRGDSPAVPINRSVLPRSIFGNQHKNRKRAPVNPRQLGRPVNRPSVPLNRIPFNQRGNQQQPPSNLCPVNPPVSRQLVPENCPERINTNSLPLSAPKTDRLFPTRNKN